MGSSSSNNQKGCQSLTLSPAEEGFLASFHVACHHNHTLQPPLVGETAGSWS
jgi:hypothetical protein